MKALLCAQCFDIRSLDPDGDWVKCRCGRSEARWLDPAKGTVRARGTGGGHWVRILGMNNSFLIAAARGFSHEQMVAAGGEWEAWRKLHDTATQAPGYIFNKDKRACWACVVQVGATSDVAWELEEKETKP